MSAFAAGLLIILWPAWVLVGVSEQAGHRVRSGCCGQDRLPVRRVQVGWSWPPLLWMTGSVVARAVDIIEVLV
jgi:hypothetical protein